MPRPPTPLPRPLSPVSRPLKPVPRPLKSLSRPPAPMPRSRPQSEAPPQPQSDALPRPQRDTLPRPLAAVPWPLKPVPRPLKSLPRPLTAPSVSGFHSCPPQTAERSGCQDISPLKRAQGLPKRTFIPPFLSTERDSLAMEVEIMQKPSETITPVSSLHRSMEMGP